MRKVVIPQPGGYAQLRLRTYPDPRPGPGQVLVVVEAAGVNFADCLTRMGYYGSARHYGGYPITPGFEATGRILAIGAGTMGWRVGDAVMLVTRFGGYADRILVRPEYLFPLPKGWTMVQAAGFPAVYLTAWHALFELAHPHKGDCMLVHSAAGGVGGALVQLGRIAGCRVVGVVGAAHKRAAVERLGAAAVIDKSGGTLWKEAERLAPDGYQVILDANGPSTLKESYAHLAVGGKLVVYGFHGMFPHGRGRPGRLRLLFDYLRTPRFNPFQLTSRNRSVLGFNLSYLFERRELLRMAMRQLLDWAESGFLHPPEVTGYPVDRVADAHRALESGQTRGKLVLLFNQGPDRVGSNQTPLDS